MLYIYVFIPHRLHTKKSVKMRRGGSLAEAGSTNGCGHWVWCVWRLLWSESCRAVRTPPSVNEWGGQADRQWLEISRWKPWGWLVGERLIHQSPQTAYVTFDTKLMKTAQWWLKNLYRPVWKAALTINLCSHSESILLLFFITLIYKYKKNNLTNKHLKSFFMIFEIKRHLIPLLDYMIC